MEQYIQKLQHEAVKFSFQEVKSIYFGGGTPTTIPVNLLSSILSFLLNRFPCNGEITIEANPATLSLSQLKALRMSGFNRISIGLQSLCDDELQFLGRLHSSKDAIQAVRDAASAGFENISCDLIFGLPEQTIDSLKSTLLELTQHPVAHISTYSLSIEDGTPFAKQNFSLPPEDEEREMFYFIKEFLSQRGFLHYEISNFAKKGKESVHNMHYWRCGEYIGLGAGAHGFYNDKRYENVSNIDVYLETANPVISEYKRTQTDIKEEYYMLGLRMREGIPDDGNPKIPQLINVGLLEKTGANVRLTEKGIDISNFVISELFS